MDSSLNAASTAIDDGRYLDAAGNYLRALYGSFSKTAGVALNWTGGGAWNTGNTYGRGVHRVYDSGGTDGSLLLKGGVGALQLATIGALEKKLLAVQGAGSTVATTGSAGVVEGFSGAESVIIHEARGIVTTAEFAQLRAAHAAGQSATARISGRLQQAVNPGCRQR